MPIIKRPDGTIVEEEFIDKIEFERTGVIRTDTFAVRDEGDQLKQLQVNLTDMTTDTTVVLKAQAGTSGEMLLPDGPGTLARLSDIPGGGGGSITLSDVGNSPNDQAATLTGSVLNLEPADATHPGVITAGTQTIGGDKTFTGAVSADTLSATNLSGTNTGDLDLGTANGLSLLGQSLSLQAADATHTGALTDTDWNTFNNKQDALTFGSVSTSTTGVTVGNGSNSTVGPNVTVNVQTASGSQPGLLSDTDWNTFNDKQNAGEAWLKAGNAGTTPGTDFIGTSDAQDLIVKTNGITQVTFSQTGGFAANQTLVPVDGVSKDQYSLNTIVQPGVSTSTGNYTGLANYVSHDNSNTGYDLGGSIISNLHTVREYGTGTVNSTSGVVVDTAFSNVAGTTNYFKGVSSETSVGSGYTLDTYTGINTYLNSDTATHNNINAINHGANFQDVTANNYSALSGYANLNGSTALAQYAQIASGGISMNDTATSGGVYLSNFGLNLADTSSVNNVTLSNHTIQLIDSSTNTGGIAGYTAAVNLQNTSEMTYLNAFNSNVVLQDSAVATDLNIINGGLNIKNNASANGVNMVNINPQFDNSAQVSYVNLASLTANVNNNTNITGSFNGLTINPVIRDSATVEYLNPFNISPSIQDSAVINNGVTVASINLTSATNLPSVTGLSINISGASTANPLSRQGLTVEGGGAGFNNQFDVPGATTYFQNHYIGGGQGVALGDPVSTFGFGTNLAQSINFQDDWTADGSGLRLGYVNVGFVGAIGGAAGKTMDSWTGALGGAGNPSGAGTVDQAIMFRAAGFLPQGGSIAVNNMYGFQVMPTLSAVSPTNAWGVWVGDTNADNWFSKNVVIGGITGKPTGPYVLDVTGTVKIEDGTEGVGKVLTSDADGVASWQDLPAATNSYFVETFTLLSGDITNKYVTLSGTPTDPTKTTLTVIGGPMQEYSSDFIVSGSNVDWNGLFLDGVLQIGDKLVVQYN